MTCALAGSRLVEFAVLKSDCSSDLLQVSIVLQDAENSRELCVLEIGRIQLKLNKRPLDSLVKLCIYR